MTGWLGLVGVLMLVACGRPAGGDSAEGSAAVPVVWADAEYEMVLDARTYAQGLRHDDWGGAAENVPVELRLDLYVPAEAPGKRPALVMAHGGGLETGERGQPAMIALGNYFASRGFVCLSVDHRLEADHGTLPEDWLDLHHWSRAPDGRAIYPAVRDVRAAVRWLYAHAPELAVDTSRITAMGHSTGASIALALGATDEADFTAEVPQARDPTMDTTHLDFPSRVHTVVDFWGSTVHVDAVSRVSGIQRFDEADAPVVVFHGDEDEVLDIGYAAALQEHHRRTGVPFALHVLRGWGHDPWDATVDGRALNDVALDFIVDQQGLVLRD